MKKLSGQTAWISGGASGIGEGIAELFVAQGANIIIADNNAKLGKQTAERLNKNNNVVFTACDVSQAEQVKNSIKQAITNFGSLNIVINCAGITQVSLLHECSEAEWDNVFNVNLKAIYYSVKYGVEYLCKNSVSYMVNIGSISSHVAQAKTPVYTASKYAVLGLSRSIAIDYAKTGLRCNCVCPGITDTPMLRKHLNTTPDPAATLAKRLNRVPTNKILTPNDIARTVLYLSCEDSAGVTATSIVVDGGYISCAEWDASHA